MNHAEAVRLRRECRFEPAEALLRKLLQEAASDADRAELHAQLAFALACQDRTDEALHEAHDALTLANRASLDRVRGHALRIQGIILWARGCQKEALELCREAQAIAASCGDEELRYQSGISVGSILINKGDYEEGMRLLDSGVMEAEAHGDWQQAATAHTNLGIALCAQGDTERGTHHHRQAQNIYQRYPSPAHMAMCLLNLALACAEEEDYEEALTFHLGGLEFLPPRTKPLADAALRAGAGQALYWLDRIDEAVPYLENAVVQFSRASHIPGAAESLSFLGACLVRTGHRSDGLEACRKALELIDQVGRKDIQTEVLMMAGCALMFADEYSEAATFLRGAHSLAEESGDRRMMKRVQRFLDPCLARLENR